MKNRTSLYFIGTRFVFTMWIMQCHSKFRLLRQFWDFYGIVVYKIDLFRFIFKLEAQHDSLKYDAKLASQRRRREWLFVRLALPFAFLSRRNGRKWHYKDDLDVDGSGDAHEGQKKRYRKEIFRPLHRKIEQLSSSDSSDMDNICWHSGMTSQQ